ncbi:MAG: ABC transporter substrate-binding protein [Alphaproteobacteria bacterium]|nr:ABC transporter substrate-binding protein [Alphaproteobacteria bacterium]
MVLRALVVLAVLIGFAPAGVAQTVTESHGTSLLGALKYGPDFTHFAYVDPEAPKGGTIRHYALGTFDTLNPFTLKGTAAAQIGSVFETLMLSPEDESSSQYGLIAESITVPSDHTWVAFRLRPEARWHDGRPITVADVIFSFETLKTKGHPFYRAYYANVAGAEPVDDRTVRFTFTGGLNRELPHIVGQLAVLPKHYFEGIDFEKTTLAPPLGSGPYRVASVDAGRSIVYERVKDYWGAALPVNVGRDNFDLVQIDYYRDDTAAVEAFKAHQYDFRIENSAKRWATGYDTPALAKGLMIKENIAHELPTGMQAFVFNTRLAKFQDPRVREAIGQGFDFEWANKNLFYGQYTRTDSYFSNSELAARGLPGPAELAYLEPLRGHIPAAVFTREFSVPVSDGSGSDRRLLHRARELLAEAGWTVEGGKLVGPDGAPLVIEFLLVQPDFERVVQPFLRSLERLGISGTIRTVDSAQYQNRLDNYEFDMVVGSFGQSESPGNEQRDFWGSMSADTPGGRNLAGIKNPAVDALIDALIEAPDRAALVAATRALDRVLLWNHYVVPQYHLRTFRVAYWNRFGRPPVTPRNGVGLDSWWIDPVKDAALQRGEAALKGG